MPRNGARVNDNTRGWLYFNLVLQHAGIALSPATEAALRELAEYHAQFNLWESVPREVPDALDRLRAAGHRLVVVSNSNGTVRSTARGRRLRACPMPRTCLPVALATSMDHRSA